MTIYFPYNMYLDICLQSVHTDMRQVFSGHPLCTVGECLEGITNDTQVETNKMKTN